MGIESYVKFVRGTPTAYENLLVHDKDTLYFIKEKGAATGLLYLGDVLIAGGASESAAFGIAGLKDVKIEGDIEDGSLLVYDLASGAWVNQSVSDFVGVEVMNGASAEADGKSGLVPQPKAGENNLFLRGDGSWAAPVGVLSEDDQAQIQGLQDTLDSLIGDSAEEDEDGNVIIPSIKDIAVGALEEVLIPESAKESLDTLQEIADWIQSHPEDASAMASDISDLQDTVGDIIDVLYDSTDDDGNTVKGLISTVNDLVASTPEGGPYVTVINYEAEVGDISELYSTVENEDGSTQVVETTLVAQIKSINERLSWIDIE